MITHKLAFGTSLSCKVYFESIHQWPYSNNLLTCNFVLYTISAETVYNTCSQIVPINLSDIWPTATKDHACLHLTTTSVETIYILQAEQEAGEKTCPL